MTPDDIAAKTELEKKVTDVYTSLQSLQHSSSTDADVLMLHSTLGLVSVLHTLVQYRLWK